MEKMRAYLHKMEKKYAKLMMSNSKEVNENEIE